MLGATFLSYGQDSTTVTLSSSQPEKIEGLQPRSWAISVEQAFAEQWYISGNYHQQADDYFLSHTEQASLDSTGYGITVGYYGEDYYVDAQWQTNENEQLALQTAPVQRNAQRLTTDLWQVSVGSNISFDNLLFSYGSYIGYSSSSVGSTLNRIVKEKIITVDSLQQQNYWLAGIDLSVSYLIEQSSLTWLPSIAFSASKTFDESNELDAFSGSVSGRPANSTRFSDRFVHISNIDGGQSWQFGIDCYLSDWRFGLSHSGELSVADSTLTTVDISYQF